MSTPEDLTKEIQRCSNLIFNQPATIGAYIIRENIKRAEQAMLKQDSIGMYAATETLRKFR